MLKNKTGELLGRSWERLCRRETEGQQCFNVFVLSNICSYWLSLYSLLAVLSVWQSSKVMFSTCLIQGVETASSRNYLSHSFTIFQFPLLCFHRPAQPSLTTFFRFLFPSTIPTCPFPVSKGFFRFDYLELRFWIRFYETMLHNTFLFQLQEITWVQVEKFIFSFLPSPPFDKVREQELAPYLSPIQKT